MGGVFVCVGLLAFAALVVLASAFRRGRLPRVALAVVIVPFALLLAYLVAKLLYEEIIPCVAVDPKYCDFFSTQYRNLFGWEF
ncbi:MAG: hypothetical protein AVDCRST_MAG59-5262 [uncultured Thermomicrobiales bacterium]|uniref:Uncharacterized protein n=1 Tax=uncultured Thermomicrobiales bacterium TaxID=1645740 RepID=A0A6J4VNR8_9BACT|nr:MAG: hypothetical protein AVDCRST_MAG59-5262 [uncultured Thermomicrobiales bacterium]